MQAIGSTVAAATGAVIDCFFRRQSLILFFFFTIAAAAFAEGPSKRVSNRTAENSQRTEVAAHPTAAFGIQVVDQENGWPVPLVEIRTTHHVRFVTDNAGRVAFNLPELMGRETALYVTSDGYEVEADRFGFRGVRVTPEPGEHVTIEVRRTSIAKRLGRLTGAGLFAESQLLGFNTDWQESGIVGCDSTQNAVHNGKLFWVWGDTALPGSSLGIFDATGATTSTKPLERFQPPIQLKYSYFSTPSGRPRAIAKMPGDGPTWLTGLVTLPDKSGRERLVASYVKIHPPLDAYATGLCVWNDAKSEFEHLKSLWTKSEDAAEHPTMPQGHAIVLDGNDGQKRVLFGDPLPKLRCLATFEAWQDPSKWELLSPQRHFMSSADKTEVVPHTGAIAWSKFRNRWVTIFVKAVPLPSGEIWYAEAKSPTGPWGPAIRVLSHNNYTFYNPTVHAEFTPDNSPILLFEGTYTTAFSGNSSPTPRYDYNQILYRLDLDDPKLGAAQR